MPGVSVDILLAELVVAAIEALPVDLYDAVSRAEPRAPLLVDFRPHEHGLRRGVRSVVKDCERQLLGELALARLPKDVACVNPPHLVFRRKLLVVDGQHPCGGCDSSGCGEVSGDARHQDRGRRGRAPQSRAPHDCRQDESEEDVEEGAGECGHCPCEWLCVGERLAVGGGWRICRIQLWQGDISAKWQPADDIFDALVFESPELWPHADGEGLDVEALPQCDEQVAELVDEDAESKEEYDEYDLQDDRENFRHKEIVLLEAFA